VTLYDRYGKQVGHAARAGARATISVEPGGFSVVTSR
jgi:hypothetical protein